MKKSIKLQDFFFVSIRPFVVKTVTVNSQNKIDEKRNVKQPPELQIVQQVFANFIPALSKLYRQAFLYRQYSRDHYLYSPVPI